MNDSLAKTFVGELGKNLQRGRDFGEFIKTSRKEPSEDFVFTIFKKFANLPLLSKTIVE
jgi:hypothetical protein